MRRDNSKELRSEENDIEFEKIEEEEIERVEKDIDNKGVKTNDNDDIDIGEEIKNKFRLNYAFALPVGRYFENNSDFINLMKVNKKYKNIVDSFKYNPIKDISLFNNLETQFIYDKDTPFKKNAFRYVNMTNSIVNKRGISDKKVVNKRLILEGNLFKRFLKEDVIDNIMKTHIFHLPNYFSVIKEKSLHYYVFDNVIELYLPNSITVMEENSIYDMKNLKILHLPQNNKLDMRDYSINKCYSLKKLYLPYRFNFANNIWDPIYGSKIQEFIFPDDISLDNYAQFVNYDITKFFSPLGGVDPINFIFTVKLNNQIRDSLLKVNPTNELIKKWIEDRTDFVIQNKLDFEGTLVNILHRDFMITKFGFTF